MRRLPLPGLLASLVVLQTACATVTEPPRPDDGLRARMGATGVVAAGAPHETDLAGPIPGKPLAALAGMGGGLGLGVLGGMGCFASMGRIPEFCAVALWTPVMVVTGAVEGLDRGVGRDEAKAGLRALRGAMGEDSAHEALRDAVVQAARRRPVSVVALAGRGGPAEAPRPVDVDSVLEVGLEALSLRGSRVPDGKETYGPSLSFERWMHPRLALHVKARVMLRAADGGMRFARTYTYTTGPRSFLEWAQDDARAFREARAEALALLGEEIAQDFFGFRPDSPAEPALDAPEPPAAPEVAADPADPAGAMAAVRR
jgi:hypothetical protein